MSQLASSACAAAKSGSSAIACSTVRRAAAIESDT
jgi:hypothetical protein